MLSYIYIIFLITALLSSVNLSFQTNMAARVSTSAVDFAVLAKKIPDVQKNAFNALRGKVEGHLRNVNSLPASMPAIDFAAYSKVGQVV